VTTRPDWAVDGATWPNRDRSSFPHAAHLRWHVQRIGAGPVLLCLHGTGAASHSFAPLAAELARDFTLVIPDLPGHGFSDTPAAARGLSLPGMASALSALLESLDVQPDLVLGHSAGAALAVRLIVDGLPTRGLVGLNPAIMLPDNPREMLLWPLAAGIARQPLVAGLLARLARDRGTAARVLRANSPALPDDQVELYHRLWRCDGHVRAVLTMMAEWDVTPVREEVARLPVPALLLAGPRDPWFPPPVVTRLAASFPSAQCVTIEGTGHLSHEERPDLVAGAIRAFVATLPPARRLTP